jgi:hypothetical protein
MKTLKALHVPEPQISALQTILEDGESVDVGGKFAQRVFSAADLIAAGFEAMNDSVADEQATPA